MTIEKLETNLMLVNTNQLKPYKYMEFDVQKKEQRMLIYWEQRVGGVQEANSNIKEDNERCQVQKQQMKNDEDKKQIMGPIVNIVFIFDLQTSNNCNSAKFGMQKSTNDMSGVSAESTSIFAWSLGIFTQSSELCAQSPEKLVQSLDVFLQLANKWA